MGEDSHGFSNTYGATYGCGYPCFWCVANCPLPVDTEGEQSLCTVQCSDGDYSLAAIAVVHFRQSSYSNPNFFTRVTLAIVLQHTNAHPQQGCDLVDVSIYSVDTIGPVAQAGRKLQ